MTPPGERVRRLLAGTGRRGVLQIASGTVLAQGVAVLISPILTRLYDPVDFGVLAVYIALLTFGVAIATLRYELAISLPEDEDSALQIVVLCLLLSVLAAAVIGLGLVFGGSVLSPLTSEWRVLVWAVPIGILGLGSYQTLLYWAVRRSKYPTIARTKISQAVALVITQVGIGALHGGPIGLIVGELVGRTAGIGRLARELRATARDTVAKISLAGIRREAARYRRFPLFSSWSGLLNVGGLQLPAPLFVALYGAQIGGWFALAQRIALVPLALGGEAVRQVYIGHAGSLLRRGAHDELHHLFRRTTRTLALVAILPAAGLAIGGPPLFATVFGENWRTAGEFAQILSILMVSQFIVNPVAHTLDLLQRQSWWIWVDGTRLVFVVAVFLLAGAAHLSPSRTALLYSLVMAASYLAQYLLCRIFISRQTS